MFLNKIKFNYIDILLITIIFVLLLKILQTITIKNNLVDPFDPNTKSLASEKQKIYLDILRRTQDALDELNIPMFLSSGTCLGYFREGGFIEYDYDIDVGIFADDYKPEIVEKMKKHGLHLYRILGDVKTGMELSFRLPNTKLGNYAKIDLFLHYPEQKPNGQRYLCWYSYAAPKFKKKLKYRVGEFGIEKVDFLGLSVYVPSPTVTYLENHYGQDWMVPKRPFVEYSYSKSPVSIVQEEESS